MRILIVAADPLEFRGLVPRLVGVVPVLDAFQVDLDVQLRAAKCGSQQLQPDLHVAER